MVSERNLDEYVVGVIDCKGSFSSYSWKYATGSKKKPIFTLMTSNKNLLILIKNHLELESKISRRPYKNKKNKIIVNKSRNYLRLQGFYNIQKLIVFLDKHPLIVQLQEYSHFKNIYEQWKKRYAPPQRYDPRLVTYIRQLYLENKPLKEIAGLSQIPLGTLGRLVKDIKYRYKKQNKNI